MGVQGYYPRKIWEIYVQNRAFSCKLDNYIIVLYFSYKAATDFVLNAINFVVEIFDQPYIVTLILSFDDDDDDDLYTRPYTY